MVVDVPSALPAIRSRTVSDAVSVDVANDDADVDATDIGCVLVVEMVHLARDAVNVVVTVTVVVSVVLEMRETELKRLGELVVALGILVSVVVVGEVLVALVTEGAVKVVVLFDAAVAGAVLFIVDVVAAELTDMLVTDKCVGSVVSVLATVMVDVVEVTLVTYLVGIVVVENEVLVVVEVMLLEVEI